jgi:NTP pyrophosphatase (non-canonical NTP hydrolase)
MNDNDTTIKELSQVLDDFFKKRDWNKFHNPKDVAIALTIETSEILEHFRFKTNEEIMEYLKDKKNKKDLSHEMADVLHFLIALAHVTNIDLTKSSEEKLKIANKKYPVRLSKGKALKYTHYEKK